MGKLIADEWMSMDGVAQAPAYPDEDGDGGFSHGGWHPPFFDEVSMTRLTDNVTSASCYLLGRRTYEIFAAHWPLAGEEEQALAEPLNERPKYVASTTLSEPLEWHNSYLLRGEVVEAVRALKSDQPGEIHLIGSLMLARTLLEQNVVDELRLMIDPILLGAGKRIFPDNDAFSRWQLLDNTATATGAVLATYAQSVTDSRVST
jgi:dihydrofolate reductase